MPAETWLHVNSREVAPDSSRKSHVRQRAICSSTWAGNSFSPSLPRIGASALVGPDDRTRSDTGGKSAAFDWWPGTEWNRGAQPGAPRLPTRRYSIPYRVCRALYSADWQE